jgi:glycosyltransferase involved in cell wall biosynthesis
METTTAVKNLIDLNSESDFNQTIDLVRVTNFKDEKISLVEGNNLEINSIGLPYGILLIQTLKRVLRKINLAAKNNLIDLAKIDVIHSHKLTFEGYIGYKLAKTLNKPLIITIRQTDTSVIFYKPHLKHIYKKILEYSKVIFYVNPYSKTLLKKRIGIAFFESIKDKVVLLPNIVERDSVDDNINIKALHPTSFLTILRMDKRSVKRKNIKKLFKALSLIPDKKVTLDIIGSGNYENTVRRWVKKYKIIDRVTFLGKIPNNEIDDYYRNAIAFLLPSNSETFGLVYAESLLNGTPILYSKNRPGFDGFFDNVGPAVNPSSVDSIRQGIIDCIGNNLSYRQRINELSLRGEFKIFNRDSVKKNYFDTISSKIR